MKQNVLFVNPPSIPFREIMACLDNTNQLSQPVNMPMGLLYLSACLKEQAQVDKVAILDYALKINEIKDYRDIGGFIEQVARASAGFTPDIIAYSVLFSASHRFFNESLPTLRRLWPNAAIIVGGVHATNCAGELIKNEAIDYVLRGEGELALVDFVNRKAAGEPIDIKGIYAEIPPHLKNADLDCCEPVRDLDTLPLPDWDLIDMDAYVNSIGRKRDIGSSVDKKISTIITTRGCPFQCTFCSAHTVHGRTMRYRSVEKVIAEVRLLHERYGVSLFIPEDDLFTANRDRVLRLLKELKDLSIDGFELQFPNALSVNTLDEAIIDGLVDAGMKICTIAIESGSEYVQKYVIRKNCNLEKARTIIKYLKQKGIMSRCYFIMGFYGETKEQMLETIQYAKELGPDWSVFMIATPLIGSEMYRQFVQAGYIKDDINFWSEAVFNERNFDTPEISAAELKDLAYRANLECNFIHNPNMVGGQYAKAIDIFVDIVHRYPFHIIAWYCIAQCHRKLGQADKAAETEGKIRTLIADDKRSAEMYAKYKDLLPNLKI